jgi:hypothetical protein
MKERKVDKKIINFNDLSGSLQILVVLAWIQIGLFAAIILFNIIALIYTFIITSI